MPCMIVGASGGIAPRGWRPAGRRPGRQPVEVLPLGPEPVLVDGVVETTGELAEVLAAAPRVDVGAAGLVGAGALVGRSRRGTGTAGPAGRGSRSRRGRCRGPTRRDPVVRRSRDVGALSQDRPSREANRIAAREANQRVPVSGGVLNDLDGPILDCSLCPCGQTPRWRGAWRRGSRSRRSALHRVAPESRGHRRLPGGPVVAVTLRGRVFGEVVADMVEGVVIANGLEGAAATRVRSLLLDAVTSPGVSEAA